MNDLQFRKQCISDPRSPDPDFREALGKEQRRRFQQQCLAFDAKLASALEIAAADDLAQRIIARHRESRCGNRHRWSNWRPTLAAASVAATLLLAVSLLLRPQLAVSEMLIDHLYDDIDALHVRTVVSDAQLLHVLEQFNVEIQRASLGTLHFAELCEIDETTGMHFVYDGASGPVTVIYLPGKRVKRLQAIAREQFQGVVFPYHAGVMAIIGLMGEDLLLQKERVQKAISWRNAAANQQQNS
jgi:hypothetical protein